ncbi:MAG: type I DNA topoisomerase [Flavobacteriales bacterium]|nr:type I DNA topoisomerase [Flavobacteriales bacterium]
MSKNLVIVESPAKAKTIQKYLGKDFDVLSSFGHITDLPKKGMGIDIENNFKPTYKVSPEKKEVVKKLKEQAKKADIVWLASDEDREGEAIAWHLFNELKLKKDNTKRIVFHEITKSAIEKAIQNPRTIDENLVDAQQARRVLDRIVGFEVSPVLWKKVRPGLSAGRVQSVALRLIAEREKEIEKFQATSVYKVRGTFLNEDKQEFIADLDNTFTEKEQARTFLESCILSDFIIDAVEKKPAKRSPSAPFTTSTLQQEASLKLGMSVSRTMRNAQQLYEAGHITYMRTDSVNLSNEAVNSAKSLIVKEYGESYSKPRVYQTKSKGAQEAHEAIRPTNMSIKSIGDNPDQIRLYELIWRRTIASQMAEAQFEKTKVDIVASNLKQQFVASGEVIVFDGFLKVYQDNKGNNLQKGMLPKLIKGEKVSYSSIQAVERFSRPLPRYTEASLVKQLEELGIGRPSTYAPTISTIQQREYVVKGTRDGEERNYNQLSLVSEKIKDEVLTEKHGADKNKLIPTDIGIVVSDFLTENFGKILEYGFTAKVEERFDDIALGKESWTNMLQGFYSGFHSNVEDVSENAERASGDRILGEDPKTGKNVHVRIGRYGPMVQIGEVEDEEKPLFAGLLPHQNLSTITLEEALKLFELPKELGEYKDKKVEVNNGRFGPYIKYDKLYVSIPKDLISTEITLEQSKELINQKLKEIAPIFTYENNEVTKGKGRFGPYIKWNDIFINVPKKYDFDNLSDGDIVELIEDKKRKDKEKLIHFWEEEGIKLEKGRWGTSTITYGKKKINLPKTVDAQKLTLEEVQKLIKDNTPAKKTKKK